MSEETEPKATTAEIFAKVAPFLGDGWAAEVADTDYPSMGGYLVHEDGARLHAYGGYQQGSKDRLSISGVFPEIGKDVTIWPKPERGTITVAKDRTPKAMASEITRRLLPDYLLELERVRDAIARANVAAGAQSKAIAKLCDVFPLAGAQDNGVRWFNNGDAIGYGEVDLYHDGSKGSLEIKSVSFDTLAAIFKVLAKIREKDLARTDAEITESAHTED